MISHEDVSAFWIYNVDTTSRKVASTAVTTDTSSALRRLASPPARDTS